MGEAPPIRENVSISRPEVVKNLKDSTSVAP